MIVKSLMSESASLAKNDLEDLPEGKAKVVAYIERLTAIVPAGHHHGVPRDFAVGRATWQMGPECRTLRVGGEFQCQCVCRLGCICFRGYDLLPCGVA